MPKPKTAPDLSPKAYRLLKTDLAAKLSPKSQGGITYLLLADASPNTESPELHIAVTANEGGGLWSKETVRLDAIEAVIDAYAGSPFPTRALRAAMVGRSSNNPPFCLAVLKDLGLVAPAPDKAHQHVKAGDWTAFRAEWLAKPGDPVIYPAPKPEADEAGVEAEAMPAEPDTLESAQLVTGKGKKRKKVAIDEAVATDEDAPVEADPATADVLVPDEADHAPTAHA